MVKQTLKRRHPGFSEGYHGFHSFDHLLEEARRLLELDEKYGGYIIKSYSHEESESKGSVPNGANLSRFTSTNQVPKYV